MMLPSSLWHCWIALALVGLSGIPPVSAQSQSALNAQLTEAVNQQNWSRAIAIVDGMIEKTTDSEAKAKLTRYRASLRQCQQGQCAGATAPTPTAPPGSITPPPAAPVVAQAPPPASANSLVSAQQKLKAGDLLGAIDEFSAALQTNPELVAAYTGRGLAYYRLADFQAASQDFSAALERDPNNAKLYQQRGVTFFKLNDLTRALEDLNQAIGRDPKQAVPYYNRSLIYAEVGRYEDARQDSEQALQLDPKLAVAYQTYGIANYRLGQVNVAIQALDQAIKLDPQLASALQNRGYIRVKQGEWPDALDDLKAAAALYVQQNQPDLYQQVQKQIDTFAQMDVLETSPSPTVSP
ncbi:MAG: tetratricopeptide repeat protein [Cyanobacteriota bacterium]|nr:tetratricopeptide repeat protein [Cyanobacteriota bacterium]